MANWLLTRQNIDFKGSKLIFPTPTSENKFGVLRENTLSTTLVFG
ncbi:hypothetical protein [Campylobacter geochelonis]|nr:hypothetical protein [Campylobacter geochelonis]